MLRRAILFTLITLAVAAPAGAQQPTQAQASALRANCRADFQAHCAGVTPGSQAALACLQQNAASVSPPCQQALSALSAAPAPGQSEPGPPAPGQPKTATPTPRPAMSPRQEAMLLRESCGGDVRAYCPGVRFGGGRALACLEDHAQSLSPPCHDALMSARSGR